MEKIKNRMEKNINNHVVALAAGVNHVIFKDHAGNVVGQIIRGPDGKPILTGRTLNYGPRTTEIEYEK